MSSERAPLMPKKVFNINAMPESSFNPQLSPNPLDVDDKIFTIMTYEKRIHRLKNINELIEFVDQHRTLKNSSSFFVETQPQLLHISSEAPVLASSQDEINSINSHEVEQQQQEEEEQEQQQQRQRQSSSLSTTKTSILSKPKETDVCWIDIQNASAEEMGKLQEFFDLHPLTTEDCYTEPSETREKWEILNNYLFIVVHGLRSSDSDLLNLTTLNLVLFHDLVLSIHFHSMKVLDKLINRLSSFSAIAADKRGFSTYFLSNLPSEKKNRFTSINKSSHSIFKSANSSATASNPGQFGPNWILHALLDINTDLFFSDTGSIETEVQVLDDLVLILGQSEKNDLLLRINNARKRIAVLFRVLSPKKQVFEALSSLDLPHVAPELRLYMRDALDHLNIMLEKLTFAKEMLLSSQSTYLAQISIEVALSSNRMSTTVNKLTSVATIILPLTLISGIWGMNVRVPGQSSCNQEEETLVWFYVILGTMVSIFVFTALWFKYAKIL